ncbi:MAG TPA: hypothetical protein VIA06_22440 [Candidatus Dormibacteraeota bacterium]|nr:hypothetical protein [Candidatus Dormibacteraeota bacterium]
MLLAACGAAKSQASASSHHPIPRPTATPGFDCAALAHRGVSQCPTKVPWVKASITDGTNGAISEAEARKWGEAELRTWSLYVWADLHMDAGLLTAGVIADANASQTNIYNQDLQWIQEAEQAQGTIQGDGGVLLSIRLVPIPSSLQQTISAHQLQAQPYGFVLQNRGPSNVYIQEPNGQRQSLAQEPADAAWSNVWWGTYKDDPQLGPIWYASGEYVCSDALVAPTCSQ